VKTTQNYVIHPDGEIRAWPDARGVYVQGDRISIYPVGVLAALLKIRGYTRLARQHPDRGDVAREHRANTIRSEFRYLTGRIRERNWRALRNSFNGYLAEIDYPHYPISRAVGHCGRGWTRRAAIRSLRRHVTRTRQEMTR
jgi:hypothetical protein